MFYTLVFGYVYSECMPKVNNAKHRKVEHNAEYTNEVLKTANHAKGKENYHLQQQATAVLGRNQLNTYATMQLLFGREKIESGLSELGEWLRERVSTVFAGIKD